VPKTILRFAWIPLAVGLLLGPAASAGRPPYPPTRTEPVSEVIHGVRVDDPYRWLENTRSQEVQEWIARQNALTRDMLDQFPAVRRKLAQRLAQLYAAPTVSSPLIRGKRYFTTRRTAGQNHAVIYVRQGRFDAPPLAVLNPNDFSADGTVALDWWFPSPDGSLIAYGKSASGSEMSTLYVRDVATGRDTGLAIPHTRSCTVAWDGDGRGFLYTRYPEPGSVPPGEEVYHRTVYHHRLGRPWRDDPACWGRDRPKEEWPVVYPSSDFRHQFLLIERGWSRQDLYLREAGTERFRPIAVGLNARHQADTLGDRLVILTNYQAPRYRVVTAPLDHPGPNHWKEIIPQQAGVIESLHVVGGKLVAAVSENAYSRLLIFEPDGTPITEVELPALGTVLDIHGRPDGHALFFRFESLAYPPAIFRYDLGTHRLEKVDALQVAFDPARFETRQVWFESRDGTRVPMFVFCRAGLKLDGTHPAVLYGYGGFNISIRPRFIRHAIPFVESGGVYALANLRGGGEFGEQWHQAGMLDKKQNVFDDMAAAARKLVTEGYTRPERLGLRGGSNGGLLIGAMITQHPDLFQAALCAVPLLDMVRYHRFSIARLWIPEYGSAEDPEQFKFLYAYSPYHHVRDGVAYPAVLLTTAESDSRVDPMHALKMAARLQAATSSDRPILLWVERNAGHGKGKPLAKRIDEHLDEWTFFTWQLGMIPAAGADTPPPAPPASSRSAADTPARR